MKTHLRRVRLGVTGRSALAAGLAVAGLLGGCGHKKQDATPTPAASASSETSGEVDPALLDRPLAKVGDKQITLGEYAAVLDRMNRFERMRFQSVDRRKALLDELIDLELLAAEAHRRGLDQRPEVEERVRQVLRDALLEQVRRELPGPDDLSPADVRRYYDEHGEEFTDPERRRVAHVVVADRALAAKVLSEALAAEAKGWGELVVRYSADRLRSRGLPPELMGDLGFVSPPGQSRGTNPLVPPPVREAVFAIAQQGKVHPQVVEADGQFHIVRLLARSEARRREFGEAERAVRVALARQRAVEAEDKLEKDLRERIPVRIDEAALARVKVPAVPAPPTKP
jgi:peptidyl-prolyl cis-trans isomerase C